MQDIDQMCLFKPLCKYTATINHIRDIVPTVKKALQEAQSGTPGKAGSSLIHQKAVLQFLPSATGNVFTPVCLSVILFKGMGWPTPPRQTDTPRRHPPWTDTPAPQADPPLGRHLPRDGHCSGWYASYWNAFLFLVNSKL